MEVNIFTRITCCRRQRNTFVKKLLSCEGNFLSTGQEIIRLVQPPIRRFIILILPLAPPTLSQMNQVHTVIIFFLKSTLVLSSNLRLDLPSSLSLPAHVIHCLFTLIIFVESTNYKLWAFSSLYVYPDFSYFPPLSNLPPWPCHGWGG
jgi:hypothetical protein